MSTRQHFGLCPRNFDAPGWLHLSREDGEWTVLGMDTRSLAGMLDPTILKLARNPHADFTFSFARDANALMANAVDEQPTADDLRTMLPGHSITLLCPVGSEHYPNLWANLWRNPKGGLSASKTSRFVEGVLIDQIGSWFDFYGAKKIEGGRCGAVELWVRREFKACDLLPDEFSSPSSIRRSSSPRAPPMTPGSWRRRASGPQLRRHPLEFPQHQHWAVGARKGTRDRTRQGLTQRRLRHQPRRASRAQHLNAPAPAPATDTADDTDIGFGLETTPTATMTAAQPPQQTRAPKPEPGSQYDRDDYAYEAPEGQVLTPDGEERIAAFAEHAHQSNMAPEAFDASIQFYNDLVAKELAKRAENDKASRGQLVQTLRNEWGQTYDANLAVVDQGFKSLPQSLRTAIKQARLPDGRPLSFLPELAQLMHSIGRKSTPTHDAADDLKTEEQARLYMSTDFDRYMREKWDEKLSAVLARRGAA